MVSGWSPWRALRESDEVRFRLGRVPDEFGDGVVVRRRGHVVILLDRRLTRAERKVALAHELVHLERDGVVEHPDQPASWADVVAREEGMVNKIVAERLIPPAQLVAWLETRDDGVMAFEIAEEFDVTDEVAVRAAMALIDRRAA